MGTLVVYASQRTGGRTEGVRGGAGGDAYERRLKSRERIGSENQVEDCQGSVLSKKRGIVNTATSRPLSAS